MIECLTFTHLPLINRYNQTILSILIKDMSMYLPDILDGLKQATSIKKWYPTKKEKFPNSSNSINSCLVKYNCSSYQHAISKKQTQNITENQSCILVMFSNKLNNTGIPTEDSAWFHISCHSNHLMADFQNRKPYMKKRNNEAMISNRIILDNTNISQRHIQIRWYKYSTTSHY